MKKLKKKSSHLDKLSLKADAVMMDAVELYKQKRDYEIKRKANYDDAVRVCKLAGSFIEEMTGRGSAFTVDKLKAGHEFSSANLEKEEVARNQYQEAKLSSKEQYDNYVEKKSNCELLKILKQKRIKKIKDKQRIIAQREIDDLILARGKDYV